LRRLVEPEDRAALRLMWIVVAGFLVGLGLLVYVVLTGP